MAALSALLDEVLQAHLDLAWSWWTELGVPGSRRLPVTTTLHPEALVVFTAPLIAFDARLREHAIGWVLAHGNLMGSRQVLAVANRLPAVPAAMADLTATLKKAGGPTWASCDVGTPLDGDYRPLDRRLDLGQPALALLRLRAALGVHARAEILAVLAGNDTGAMTHADLALYIASTPRNVRLALDELVSAGVVTIGARAPAQRYRCERPDALRQCIGPIPAMPPWPTLLPAVTALHRALLGATSDIERSVNAKRAADHHRETLDHLDLPRLPAAHGHDVAPAVATSMGPAGCLT